MIIFRMDIRVKANPKEEKKAFAVYSNPDLSTLLISLRELVTELTGQELPGRYAGHLLEGTLECSLGVEPRFEGDA